MTEKQFWALIDLMMCCDPWPVTDREDVQEKNQRIVEGLMDDESKKRGYVNWYDAFRQRDRGPRPHSAVSPDAAIEAVAEWFEKAWFTNDGAKISRLLRGAHRDGDEIFGRPAE